MGEIVNLRRVRKARARAAADEAAAHNRLRFGRTKAERSASCDEAARRAAALDGHRLEGSEAPRGDTSGE